MTVPRARSISATEDTDYASSSLGAEWKEIISKIAALESNHDKYVNAALEVSKLEHTCLKEISALKKALKSIRKDIELSGLTAAENKNWKENIVNKQQNLDLLAQSFPIGIGTWLSLLLGNVNVTLPMRSDRLKYKQEYEEFKLFLTGCIVTGAILALVFPYRIVEVLFHLLLSFFYGSVSLRERILLSNGSRIRFWWRLHNYGSTIMSLLMMIWPEGETYKAFHTQFMLFCLYVGVVQFIQYNYQIQLLYKKRALGKTSEIMDTTTDFQESPNNPWFLTTLTALIVAYCFQLYNAYTLYHIFYLPNCTEWHVAGCGMLYLCLGLGNFYTTRRVFSQKLTQGRKNL